MLKAVEVGTLVEELSWRLDSVCTWSNQAFAGTSDGHILSFALGDSDKEDRASDSKAKGRPKRVCRSPITQLATSTGNSTLFALADGLIYVLGMPTLKLLETIGRGRGCTALAWNEGRGQLAVAAKRKALVYTQFQKGFDVVKEVALPDTPRGLTWSSERWLMAAFRREYSFIDLEEQTCTSVAHTGRTSPPSMARLEGFGFVAVQDAIGTIIDEPGETGVSSASHSESGASAETPEPIRFSEPVHAICFSPPYVLAAGSRMVDTRFASRDRVGQAIGGTVHLPRVKAMCPVEGCRAPDIEQGGDVIVATESSLHCVRQFPLVSQVRDLADQNFFEAAFALSECLEDELVRQKVQLTLRARHGFTLFAAGRYEDSFSMLSHAASGPVHVLSLVPGFLPENLRKMPSSEFGVLGADVLGTWSPPDFQDLQGDEIRLAKASALPYLEQMRQSSSVVDECEVALVDTALVKAMVAQNARFEDFKEIFEHGCRADESEAERELARAERHREVVEMYWSQGKHREALDRLQKQWQEENRRLLEVGPGHQMERCFGPEEMAKYLRKLGGEHEDLLLEYSLFVLREDMDLGLSVLQEALPRIDVDNVLNHLKSEGVHVEKAYLERLAMVEPDRLSAKHYDALVDMYLESPSDADEESEDRKSLRGLLASETVPCSLNKVLSKLEGRRERTWARERAIIYGRLGQHDEAVQAYANELGRLDLAEEHCDLVHQSRGASQEEGSNAHLTLLRVLLEERHSYDLAISLLARKGDRLEVGHALSELPQSLPLDGLMPFFQSALRRRGQERRRLSVLRGLYRAQDINLRESLVHLRQRSVVLTEDRACSVCRRRIDTSAFAVSPDGALSHYKCWLHGG